MQLYHWTKINVFFTDIDLQPLLSIAAIADNRDKRKTKEIYQFSLI